MQTEIKGNIESKGHSDGNKNTRSGKHLQKKTLPLRTVTDLTLYILELKLKGHGHNFRQKVLYTMYKYTVEVHNFVGAKCL